MVLFTLVPNYVSVFLNKQLNAVNDDYTFDRDRSNSYIISYTSVAFNPINIAETVAKYTSKLEENKTTMQTHR